MELGNFIENPPSSEWKTTRRMEDKTVYRACLNACVVKLEVGSDCPSGPKLGHVMSITKLSAESLELLSGVDTPEEGAHAPQ